MRFGYGKLYNRKNELIFDGEWFNNSPVINDICMITDELKDRILCFIDISFYLIL